MVTLKWRPEVDSYILDTLLLTDQHFRHSVNGSEVTFILANMRVSTPI